ncbi:MAG: hypothetical protein SFV22_06490, partial [Saprospiraceae bacterium]|nr:hypothetical protein [Saprospiraceae bacterium]
IFQNNRKDVEFLSYKFALNKSRFFNTTFIEIGNTFANTEGVTIWDTDGIVFQNCLFKGKDREGIYTYDAGVSILNDNKFENNMTGVVTTATYPMSSKVQIGSGSTTENKFTSNGYAHIFASQTAGLIGDYSLDIINNNFTGGIYGIIVDGTSNFRIAGNLLTTVGWGGTGVHNTGVNSLFNQNLIGCNTYKNCSTNGINAWGNNKEMQFLGNDFQMNNGHDFILGQSSSSTDKGTIRSIQGESNNSAGNCFTDPGPQNDIFAPQNVTNTFKYYFQGGEPPLNCDPEPLTPGNYTKQAVLQSLPPIDCNQYGGLPQGLQYPTAGDLNIRRTTLHQLAPSIATNEYALNQYYKTLQEKDAILRHLLKQALEAGQYSTAEDLLLGEQSKAAEWAVFGLRMEQKDYTNAAVWLNQLPIQNNDDATFRDIQLINLQRLQNLGSFQLSATQDSFLTLVAESSSPIRGYAQSILALLKDRRFYPDNIASGEGYIIPEQPSLMEKSIQTGTTIRVFPVPANTLLTVIWPSLPVESDARILVYDILGQQQIDEPIASNETHQMLETGELPIGVYFLIISDRGKPLYQTNFSIQR